MRDRRRLLRTAAVTVALTATLVAPAASPPAGADGNEAPAAPAASRALTAGGTHTCAIVSGAVYCWGGNGSGQLGLNDTINRGDTPAALGYLQPVTPLGTGRTATAITAGNNHTCALLDNATVKCWGANGSGQLGLGDTTGRGDGIGQMGNSLPAVSLGTGRTATAVAAGGTHSCALLDNHQVKCWGANGLGQLGLGDTNARGDGANEMGDNLTAVNLGSGRTATALTAGNNHTCALLDNAAVKCWGANGSGQLGLGDTNAHGDGPNEMGDNLTAVNLGSGRTATALTAGNNHTCALLDNAAVKCWGANGSGQLGLGDTNAHGDGPNEMGDNLAAVTLGAGRTALGVSAGGTQTCARLDNSRVKCWGDGNSGQLGLGDTNTQGDGANEMGDNLPAVDLGAGRTAVSVTAGSDHSCAELDNGDRKCWGWNAEGELGQGDTRRRGIAPSDLGDNLLAIALPPLGRLVGQVRDAQTNQTIPGVDVAVLRTADFGLVKVAAGGSFSTDLRPGTYFLYLLDGTASHREGFVGPPTTVTVTDGVMTTTNATMAPTRGSFSGTVTDQRTGQPIPGALVFAIGPAGITGRAVAASNGQYTLSGLATGSYHAVFLDPVGGRTARYYPSSPDFGGSAPFNVVAGATTPGIDGSLSHP